MQSVREVFMDAVKNVLFLFGVNGVGKSTLAAAIAAQVAGSKTVSGSVALREAFGGVSREELERMDTERKRLALRDALLDSFTRYADAPLVICDTHLIVPVRDACGVQYEQMWDEAYVPYGAAFCNVTAPIEDIVARRREDVVRSGRVRLTDSDTVRADVDRNDAVFGEIFGAQCGSLRIRNVGDAYSVAAFIVRRFFL